MYDCSIPNYLLSTGKTWGYSSLWNGTRSKFGYKDYVKFDGTLIYTEVYGKRFNFGSGISDDYYMEILGEPTTNHINIALQNGWLYYGTNTKIYENVLVTIYYE